MNAVTVNIESNSIEKLQSIAKTQGETTDQLLSKIIDDYLTRTEFQDENMNLMKLSEHSFNEWDNEDDAIYDTM